jgi:hypothetical protein
VIYCKFENIDNFVIFWHNRFYMYIMFGGHKREDEGQDIHTYGGAGHRVLCGGAGFVHRVVQPRAERADDG